MPTLGKKKSFANVLKLFARFQDGLFTEVLEEEESVSFLLRSVAKLIRLDDFGFSTEGDLGRRLITRKALSQQCMSGVHHPKSHLDILVDGIYFW